MIPLLLVAAGGLARETLEAVRAQESYDVIGCLDDDPARHGDVLDGVKVLGGLEMIADHPDVSALICAGRGAVRTDLRARLDIADERYATVIHPSVVLPASCSVGAGSILLAGVVLTASVEIGRHVVAMPHVVFTHDDVVGDDVTLCAGVLLGGSVTIGRGAYLGMGSMVRENVTIAPGAVVGMGAVVVTDVPAGCTWLGVPARPQRPRPRPHPLKKAGES